MENVFLFIEKCIEREKSLKVARKLHILQKVLENLLKPMFRPLHQLKVISGSLNWLSTTRI